MGYRHWTHTAGPLNASDRHPPKFLAADSSWCLWSTLWQHTGLLCRHRGDCKKISYKWHLIYLCDVITDILICRKHFSDKQQNGCFGLKITDVTRVCSRASSASTLSSSTEPVRSEFPQKFPVKRGHGQNTTICRFWTVTCPLLLHYRVLLCEWCHTCSMTTCLPW